MTSYDSISTSPGIERRALLARSCERCRTRPFALCKPLSVKQIHTLSPLFFPLPSKKHLYYEGSHITETYTLCEGWLLLYRVLQNGKRHIVWIALPGDVLGARPAYYHPVRHAAMTLTACAFCGFPHLTETACRYPELALRIAALYAETMALQRDYLTFIAQRNATERVAFLALDLYRRLRRRGLACGNRMPFPLTQEDIADTLGITAVHVNRVLHRLSREGLLVIKHHELTILDYQRLCEFVDSEEITPSD